MPSGLARCGPQNDMSLMTGHPSWLKTRVSMQRIPDRVPQTIPTTFAPSLRALIILLSLAAAAVGLALYLRYGIIQNTPIGLACEAGEQNLTCTVRLATILLFVNSAFGLTALA